MGDLPKNMLGEGYFAALLAEQGLILQLPVTGAVQGNPRESDADYDKRVLSKLPSGVAGGAPLIRQDSHATMRFLAENYDIIIIEDNHVQTGIQQFISSHLSDFRAGGGTDYGPECTPESWKIREQNQAAYKSPETAFLKFIDNDSLIKADLMTRIEKSGLKVLAFDYKSEKSKAFLAQLEKDGYDLHLGFPPEVDPDHTKTATYREKNASGFDDFLAERKALTASHWVPNIKNFFTANPNAKLLIQEGGKHTDDLDRLLQEATGKRIIVISLDDASVLFKKSKDKVAGIDPKNWNNNFLHVVDKSKTRPREGEVHIPEIRGLVPLARIQRAMSCPDYAKIPEGKRNGFSGFEQDFAFSEMELRKFSQWFYQVRPRDNMQPIGKALDELADGLSKQHEECCFGSIEKARAMNDGLQRKIASIETYAKTLKGEECSALEDMAKEATEYTKFVERSAKVIDEAKKVKAAVPIPPPAQPFIVAPGSAALKPGKKAANFRQVTLIVASYSPI